MLGRRQAELAEHVLALVYESRDAIAAARSRFVAANEMEPRDNENVEFAKLSETAPARRHWQETDLFASLRAPTIRVHGSVWKGGQTALADFGI